MRIDIGRCLAAMKKIEVSGLPDTDGRKAMIEEAIALIQTNPVEALSKRYLGFKNYAAFGDQREDHQYGMGPRHGNIVFSIGRSRPFDGPLDADCIYFLECFRDFGSFNPNANASRRDALNLAGVLRKYRSLSDELKFYTEALAEAEVEQAAA